MSTSLDRNYFSQTFSRYCALLSQAFPQGNETELSRIYEAMGKLLILSEEFLTYDEYYLFITTLRRTGDLDLDRDLIRELKAFYLSSLTQQVTPSQGPREHG